MRKVETNVVVVVATFALLLCLNFVASSMGRKMASQQENTDTSSIHFPFFDDNDSDAVMSTTRVSYRNLQTLNGTAHCYVALDPSSNPGRYCTFENTPREGTFLKLACPDGDFDSLSSCQCEIGIGSSDEAPNTPTCTACSFCPDGTLSYNCDNVATGTCIGRNCNDDCLASVEFALEESSSSSSSLSGQTTRMAIELTFSVFVTTNILVEMMCL